MNIKKKRISAVIAAFVCAAICIAVLFRDKPVGCIEYADVSDIYVEHIVDGRTADVSGDIDGESLTEIFSGTGSKLFLDATGPYSRDDAEWLIMVSGNANKSYVVILGKKNYWYVPNQLFCNKIYDAGKIKAALMAMAG